MLSGSGRIPTSSLSTTIFNERGLPSAIAPFGMTGCIEQISISKGGVPKLAVPTARVTSLGLEGDLHANPEIHGGPRQAVLWISAEGIDELIAQGFPLFQGALGENLTTRGIDRRQWRAGQRWRIGSEVILELTKMRAPCATLNPYGRGIQKAIYDDRVQAKDPSSPLWGLAGVYASVVRPGTIRNGDPVSLMDEVA